MIYRLYIKALCELLADDTSLHNYHTNPNTLIDSLPHSIDSLIDWTEMNHMALHPDKTVTTRQKNLAPNLPYFTNKSDIIREVKNKQTNKKTTT